MSGPTEQQLRDDPCPLRFARPVGGFYRVWQISGPDTDRAWALRLLTAHNLTDRMSLPSFFADHSAWIGRHFRDWADATWPDGTVERAPKHIQWRAFGQWVRDQCRAASADEPADVFTALATSAARSTSQPLLPALPGSPQTATPGHQGPSSDWTPGTHAGPPGADDVPLPSGQSPSAPPHGSAPPSPAHSVDQPFEPPSFVDRIDGAPAGPLEQTFPPFAEEMERILGAGDVTEPPPPTPLRPSMGDFA